MDKKFNAFSLWAIDSFQDKAVLKKQMKDFLSLGFNGVVFHPRRYDGYIQYLSSEYMSTLSELILFAKSIGLDFWLYDENGWPSGNADGQVIKNMPELKCRWLEYADGKVVIKERNGINSIDKQGVECFIKLTYDGYKNGLSKEAFDYVGGFFSDEVGFLEGHGACMDRSGISWSDEIAEKYTADFGGNITEKLSELFSEKESEFKIWYWETLTTLLASNFYGAIEKWCKENGKLYTAHLKGEENPFFQIGYSGSCFQNLKNISVPGVDALERYPGNKYYPKIASSLSKQFGNGVAMAEAMGGAGWGLEPADIEKYTDWLIKCGINMIIFHINQLHLTYDGITDWPASIPCHQPWRKVFPTLIERMQVKADNKQYCDTLVICPTRGVMSTFSPNLVQGMNEHNGSRQMVNESSRISKQIVDICEKLYDTGIDFDVTEEKIFEELGKTEEDFLSLGKCKYKYIIAADGCIFNQQAAKMLKAFQASTESVITKKSRERIFQTEKYKDIKQSEWKYTTPLYNRYFVEIDNGNGKIYTDYPCDCLLLVSDKCDKVMLNNIQLSQTKNDEYGFWYSIPSKLLNTECNTLALCGAENAFVYVIGDFAVKNRHPFYEFDTRQLYTKNGFYITKKGDADNNFILSGYPFSSQAIVCEKEIEGNISGFLKINCNHIAAAKVSINNKEIGWVYGGKECIKINGTYKNAIVKCEVYQSAFNIYGPHHHIEGDRSLISPMQFYGIKNFADTSFLPQSTWEENMKFVKWQMSENIEITE